MKKISFILGFIVLTLGMASCGGHDDNKPTYKNFIGTWGVEKIEYWEYNIDYAGNPIAASYEKTGEFEYDVNDPGYGIQLVYNSDKSGEYRDFAIDSMWFKWDETIQDYDVYLTKPEEFDSVIACPDTTLIYRYTYLFDSDENALYMNMDYLRTFKMTIVELNEDSFISENRFSLDQATHTEKMEKFFMKRVGNAPKSFRSTQRHQPVSRLTQELFNQEH